MDGKQILGLLPLNTRELLTGGRHVFKAAVAPEQRSVPQIDSISLSCLLKNRKHWTPTSRAPMSHLFPWESGKFMGLTLETASFQPAGPNAYALLSWWRVPLGEKNVILLWGGSGFRKSSRALSWKQMVWYKEQGYLHFSRNCVVVVSGPLAVNTCVPDVSRENNVRGSQLKCGNLNLSSTCING